MSIRRLLDTGVVEAPITGGDCAPSWGKFYGSYFNGYVLGDRGER
jgi:hypothetical protein